MGWLFHEMSAEIGARLYACIQSFGVRWDWTGMGFWIAMRG
jgi:hypothetical protein